MSQVAAASTVTAGYAQKVTEDLALTKKEQERVRAELARLQDELQQLEESEKVLVKMQDVLGGSSELNHGGGKKAPVPAARRGKGATTRQKKVSRTAKPSKAGREAPAGKTASPKGEAEETWAALASSYLAGQNEPKSAAEVSAALTEAHPQRKVQAPVVRNALEHGVARGLLERSKQGRSVYYTPASAATAASSDEPATSAQ
ncbi:hypothetical protein [Streptomyces sp. NBC_00887]|uniref:hypothetical protein n=1 Tax=Streptomyces sp. NBC_00887 TaxID=2975859 RepID=UPI0038655DC7|nr:hypothetical protein OG844_01300 [Streptomyces sp. NBC_00887]WSY36200.1 hypothetical protein OG844_44295 [Streptomyces sp. NBC_00887]